MVVGKDGQVTGVAASAVQEHLRAAQGGRSTGQFAGGQAPGTAAVVFRSHGLGVPSRPTSCGEAATGRLPRRRLVLIGGESAHVPLVCPGHLDRAQFCLVGEPFLSSQAPREQHLAQCHPDAARHLSPTLGQGSLLPSAPQGRALRPQRCCSGSISPGTSPGTGRAVCSHSACGSL